METAPLEPLLSAAMLIGLRVGGLMLFAPFLSNQGVPAQVKVGLTVALTALLYPVCRPPRLEVNPVGWIGIAGGELVVGLVLGLAVQLVVEAVILAGHIVGVQAGYSLVSLFDPQSQADTPVMATFNQLLVLLIFLQLNVHHWLLRALVSSFTYLPAGSELSQAKSAAGLLQAASGIWRVGLQLAAPVLVATLLVDVSLGFLAKASPQLPVLFLGLPIKTLLSLAVLAGTLALWPGIFEHRFAAGISAGERLLRLAR